MTAPQITIDALTTAPTDGALAGSGTFDVLIRSVKEHLDQEYQAGRVVGREFATLYLGSLQAVLAGAMDFVFKAQQSNLDAQIKDQQLVLGAVEIQKAQAELQNLQAQKLLIDAQRELATQQKANLADELATAAAQRARLAQETANLVTQQTVLANQAAQVAQQTANLVSQKAQVEAETALTTARTANAAKEGLVLDQQKLKLVQDTELVVRQQAVGTAQAALVTQQKTNLEDELATAAKQRTKLDQEVAVLASQRQLNENQAALAAQKVLTERAQIDPVGVDADSVVGRQKALYQAQADGFLRDAEQKAVKILVDTWNVRRTTDEGTVADATNKLQDATVGAMVVKLAAGIGVTV